MWRSPNIKPTLYQWIMFVWSNTNYDIFGAEAGRRVDYPWTGKLWIFFMKTLKAKGFFAIWNHHNCLSQLFPIHLNTYVMGLRPLEIFLLLQCGDRLQSSESDVYRRQILTTKVDPRTVRVKPLSVIKSFLFHFIADQITVIRNKMSVLASRFANVWFQIKQIIMSNYHTLEVLGRGSETQLQVSKNLNYLNYLP